MPKIQDLKALEIDGKKHLVEDLSDDVQALVGVYNEWNQDFADSRKKTAQLQAAVQMAHNQLSAQLQSERQAELDEAAELDRIAAEAAAGDQAEAAVDDRFGQEQTTEVPE